jgi:hypothetical protein
MSTHDIRVTRLTFWISLIVASLAVFLMCRFAGMLLATAFLTGVCQ